MLSRFTPLFLLFVLSLCFTCQEKPTNFSKKIQGKWEYSILDLIINEGEADSKHILLNDEKSWFDGFRMKPMQAVFAKDGFFKVNYPDGKGQVRFAITGDWSIKDGNQLTLVQDAPHEETFHYTIENYGKKGLKFSGLINFDKGKVDNDNMTLFLNPLQ